MSVQSSDSIYREHITNFHLIPGRLRIGIAGLLNNQDMANHLAHRLAKFPGIRLSHANPITGQVLISYDPPKTDLKHLLAWLARISAQDPATVAPARCPEKATKRHPLERTPAPWHVLGTSKALDLLGSSETTGLSRHTVRQRIMAVGPNELQEGPGFSFWQAAWESINGLMTKLLFGAAGLSLLVGEKADAAVIAAIVAVQAGVEAAQSCRTEKSLQGLKQLTAPMATVLRDGEVVRVPSRELVPGDILHLEGGDMVPADAIIIEAANLTTNEACLTGESIPVVKDNRAQDDPRTPVADQDNMLFSGTSITGGRARALVVTTGMQTELGRIAGLLSGVDGKQTNLQRQLDYLGKKITHLVVCSVGTIAMINLLRGRHIWDVLRASISLAVGAVPEGLPAVLTIALSTGAQRMVRRNALVRNMSAVETLGTTTVVCTDKTGTLTKNEMTVKELYIDNTLYTVTGDGYRPQGEIRPRDGVAAPDSGGHVRETLRAAALCTNAQLRPERGKWTVIGDPTEGALLTVAAKAGLYREDLEKEYPRHREIAFDADRRLMTVVCRRPDGGYSVHVKGSPDVVLNHCTLCTGDPAPVVLDLKTRRRILAANEAMAQKALRVLAVASKELSPEADPDLEDPESELVFGGLIGMADTPRDGVQDAIQKCREAGIKVVMITGDHQKTAEAIAAELGILGRGRSITGRELEQISDAEFAQIVENIVVYSRTTPDQKLRIVRALKERGQVVAMTGDGVNDAPAIKEADVGIAMGVAGTDVTRAAAGITLSDDNFVTIIDGIEEGRTISRNLSKSLSYILSGSLSQLLAVFTASVSGLPTPLLPAQILWINLVTESIPAIALTADPPERDCMRQPPFTSRGKFVPGEGGGILRKGALFGLSTFGLYACGLRWGGWSLPKAQTMAFSQLVINRVFNLLNARPREAKAANDKGNPLVLPAAALSLSMLAATMYIPFIRPLFSTVPIGWRDWALLAANAFVTGKIESAHKAGARPTGK